MTTEHATALVQNGIKRGWCALKEPELKAFKTPEGRRKSQRDRMRRVAADFVAQGLTAQGKVRKRSRRADLSHMTPEQKYARRLALQQVWNRKHPERNRPK
jgi:hypothetical protein